MKRHQGFRKLLAALVFTLVSLALTTGVAFASYGEAPPLTTEDFTAANGGPDASTQQPAATPGPLDAVQRVKITSKSIVVTFEAPGRKGGKRNMVIDYSEIIPSIGSTQKAGAAGAASAATGGRSPLVYLIGGLVGLNVLGRVRRTVRRVIR